MLMHIALTGARGGQGTSTTAAALALLAARHDHHVELITNELGTMGALLGLADPGDNAEALEVAPGLVLRSAPTPAATLVISDQQPLETAQRASEEPLARLVVLRGPCYLSLRATVEARDRVDGIVIVRESGRSVTNRDVVEITGLPVVAETTVTPQVARTIDAGVLVTTIGRRPEFSALNTYLEALESDLARPDPTLESVCPSDTSNRVRIDRSHECTDLPLPLSGSGRSRRWLAWWPCRAINDAAVHRHTGAK